MMSIHRLVLCAAAFIAAGPVGAADRTNSQDMSDAPVLVYSAELAGELEPCDCGGAHIGGLAPRAGYLAGERARHPGIIALEGGDITPGRSRNDATTFQAILSALDVMGYAALGLGERDLVQGADFLETMAARTRVALLCGNVTADDGRRPFLSHIVIEPATGRGRVRIAIIGLIADLEGFRTQAEKGGFRIEDPIVTAREVLDEIDEQTDLEVVMYHGTEADAEALVHACPSVDLVLLTTHVLGAPLELTRDGRPSRFVTGGRKGKHLAVIELDVGPSGTVQLGTVRRQEISEKIPDSPSVRALLDTFYEGLRIDKARAVPEHVAE